MRGHIRKRYEDSWSVVIHAGVNPNTGRPKYKWYTVKGTREDAEKFLTATLHQLDTNAYIEPGKLTLEEYLKRWLKGYCETNMAKSTYARTKIIVEKHLIPDLGKHIITKLQPLHIQEHYTKSIKSGRIDGKGDKLSPSTVLRHHRVLREALKHAVEWGLLIRNPSDAVKPPKREKPDPVTLDKDEVDILLKEAHGTPLYIPVLLAVHTGMRRGEIISLQWKNVDLKAGVIYVRQSVYWDSDTKEHVLKRTKNERNRKVDIAPQIVTVLSSWKKEQKKNRVSCGTGCEVNDFVCTWPDGRMISLDYCSKGFINLARKCRFNVSFHSLRHTHATLMLKLNIPPKIVSDRLGHSDSKITMDVYSHVTPSMQREAILKWEKMFFGKKEEQTDNAPATDQ